MEYRKWFEVTLLQGTFASAVSLTMSSGVIFTLNTDSGFRDVVLVTASWGLGENIVQVCSLCALVLGNRKKGAVNPDEYLVFKPTFKDDKRPIIQKLMGSKEMKMIYATGGTDPIKNTPTPQDQR